MAEGTAKELPQTALSAGQKPVVCRGAAILTGGAMKKYTHTFLKYISIMQRNFHRYMDMTLEDEHIGYGQQFFLAYIYEFDGITMYDLAKSGNFDKGTVTRAVQKLTDSGYVTIRPDEKDRRLKHLHVTEQAIPLVERIYNARIRWKNHLISSFSEEEQQLLYAQLKTMAEKSCQAVDNFNIQEWEN